MERRHFSPWRVQFGAPSLPDCPAPHRKVARTVWRLVTSGLPSTAPKGGAYSLAPRHFRIAQRRTERWRVQFGAPSFPDCPAPHRKVARTVWRLVISGLPSAAPKGGAYSLAPRHFRIAQRRTERCKDRACPPSETQGKFACRREGLREGVHGASGH